MTNKTKFMKVLGRHDYVVIPAKVKVPNPDKPGHYMHKEVTILDFTSKY